MNKLKKYAGLLNEVAPEGEFLAYINNDEEKMLREAGGKGILTQSGIRSYRGEGGYQGGSTGSSSSSSSSSSSGSSSSSSGGGGGGNSGGGGGGGGGGGRDYSSVPASTPTTSTPSYSGGGGGQDMSTVPASTPTVSAPTYSGGGQDMSTVPASPPSIGNGDDGRLDYLTGEYLDINLTPEQKEQFSDYREGISEAISPSTKTSNKIISSLLSSTLFPFAGNLYNAYIDANAMGYSVPNPFEGLFGSGNITPESIQNFQDQGGGGDNNFSNNFSNIIKQITPDSMVNQYFANLGTSSQSPLSSSLETSYNAAKANINNLLGMTPTNQQFGYSQAPYGLLSSTNMADNPFNIPYLQQRGLI